jgi:anti-sigma factor RsiW
MENIEAMLCAYVEGDLDAGGRAQIEKHLQEHPQHRKLLDELVAMRELVRGLPRAKAPMDVGDSLRQKVERSMLLEDSAVARVSGQRIDRWPQFFGIAAIFLLVASLCFILYKALGPTWKPAVFVQNDADHPPDIAALDKGTSEQAEVPESVAGTDERPAAAGINGIAQAASPAMVPRATIAPGGVSPGLAAEPILQKAQQLAVQSQQQMISVAQLDLQAIRRRLESSGYGIRGGAKSVVASGGSGNAGPVLVVVDSTDPPATKARITQFFSSNAGISWNVVPAESRAKSPPATLPSGTIADGQLAQAQNVMDEKRMLELSDADKGPASDLYVVRGLTPERADALRQTLTVPGSGPQVQVTVQSAEGLATTQPSVDAAREDDVSAAGDGVRVPTSQPAEEANSVMSANAAATTAPSAALEEGNSAGKANGGQGGAMMLNNIPAEFQASQPQSLPPVDAVLVLQGAAITAGPTTQPVLTARPAAGNTVGASTQP